jgi:hypothetical protein
MRHCPSLCGWEINEELSHEAEKNLKRVSAAEKFLFS